MTLLQLKITTSSGEGVSQTHHAYFCKFKKTPILIK